MVHERHQGRAVGCRHSPHGAEGGGQQIRLELLAATLQADQVVTVKVQRHLRAKRLRSACWGQAWAHRRVDGTYLREGISAQPEKLCLAAILLHNSDSQAILNTSRPSTWPHTCHMFGEDVWRLQVSTNHRLHQQARTSNALQHLRVGMFVCTGGSQVPPG